MITVAGFNSAIDRSMRTEVLRPGAVMRVEDVRVRPGGKGMHVALTCAMLGAPVRLVGVVDAEHRRRFEEALAASGGEFAGVEIDETIRTCVAVREADDRVTELLEPGPWVSPATCRALREAVIGGADGPVVLSGSLPRGMPPATYRDLVDALAARSQPCVLDASGEALRQALEAAPLLACPNRDEAEQVTGLRILDATSAGDAALRISDAGARVAVVSLGADGVVVASRGRVRRIWAPRQPVANPVGAGDSLAGGIAVGLSRGLEVDEAVRFGVAVAAAAVRHPEAGAVDASAARQLLDRVRSDSIRTRDERRPGEEGEERA